MCVCERAMETLVVHETMLLEVLALSPSTPLPSVGAVAACSNVCE